MIRQEAPPPPPQLLPLHLQALKTLRDTAPSLQGKTFISAAQPSKRFALASQKRSTALDDWQLLAASLGAFTSAPTLADVAARLPAPGHVRAVFQELARRRCDLSTKRYPLAAHLPVKRRRQGGIGGGGREEDGGLLGASYRAHLVLAALTDYGRPLGEEEEENGGPLLEQRLLRYWIAQGRSKLLGAAKGEEDAVLLEHARVLLHIARMEAWSQAQLLQFVHLTYFSTSSSASPPPPRR